MNQDCFSTASVDRSLDLKVYVTALATISYQRDTGVGNMISHEPYCGRVVTRIFDIISGGILVALRYPHLEAAVSSDIQYSCRVYKS